jgi:hypothetical protein
LKEICIPASVEKMTGRSLPPTLGRIEVENGNKHFARLGDFLVDLGRDWILRYVGSEVEVTTPDDIEKLDDCCFRLCESVCHLRIAAICRLSSIESRVFLYCLSLNNIDIPSPVTFIGDHCFSHCSSLEHVSFRSGSELICISDSTFLNCGCLRSITLPAGVKTIGSKCFDGCQRLVQSLFPVDSEVVRIEAIGSCVLFSCLRFGPSLPMGLDWERHERHLTCKPIRVGLLLNLFNPGGFSVLYLAPE